MDSISYIPIHLISTIIGLADISIDTTLALEKQLSIIIPRKKVHIDSFIRSKLERMCKRRMKRYKDKNICVNSHIFNDHACIKGNEYNYVYL